MMIAKFFRRSALMGALLALAAMPALAGPFRPDVRPGEGVTRLGWLSDYHEPLKGTNCDTQVFYLEGEKPGATVLLLGGTHPREIAGLTSATLVVENARVTQGRLIVIPALNASGYSVADESTNIDRFHPVKGRSGWRFLAYGDRRITVEDQGSADPDQYVHQSGAVIPGSKGGDGNETRNINRAYPGLSDGTPTQQVAYAVMELVRREEAALELDMHEADTPSWYLDRRSGEIRQGGRLAYMLVCNPRPEAMDLGAEAVINLSADLDLGLKIEPSNPAFRGLSHLEIGNAAPCLSFLFETPNPGQDSWREVHDVIADLDYPLEHRVALQLTMFQELVRLYGQYYGDGLAMENLPGYHDLMEQGVGAWLN